MAKTSMNKPYSAIRHDLLVRECGVNGMQFNTEKVLSLGKTAGSRSYKLTDHTLDIADCIKY
jgi:hypothetical protein